MARRDSRGLRPKTLYTPRSGTPPGYRWITVEVPGDHPLQYRHILMAADGTIGRIQGRRARYWNRYLKGRSVALVAPASADRAQIRRARSDVAEARGLLAEAGRDQKQGRRATVRLAADEWDTAHQGMASIVAAVRKLGGVRRDADYGREWAEEIPLAARNSRGAGADVVATELRAYGWQVDGDGLLRALAHHDRPANSRAAFVQAAVREYDEREPHSEMMALMRQVIRETPRLRKRRR